MLQPQTIDFADLGSLGQVPGQAAEILVVQGGQSYRMLVTLLPGQSLNFANISGMIADAQIPDGIMRDAEFTASAVRALLGLTAQEVNDIVTGGTITGQVISLPQNDGSTITLTIPAGSGGMADGVIQSGTFENGATELVLTIDTGATVTIDVPATLRAAQNTAAQILAALLTVDGAGSGLDADLLDGLTPAEVAALGGGGAGFHYPIPNADVVGTDDIALTTGASLANYLDGMVVTFQVQGDNTGPITLNVDGIGSRPLRRNDGVGGSEEFAAGELPEYETILALYAADSNRFFWAGGRVGTVSRQNVGILEGLIPLLGSGGRFVAARLPANIAYESGAVFTGAAGGIDPVADADFVTKGYADSNYSGGGVTPTHTSQYLAGKATNVFAAADFTSVRGVAYADGSHTAVLPTQAGNVYGAVARLSTDPTPTHADVNGSGFNEFTDFTLQAGTIDIAGSAYDVYVSNYAVFATGDSVEFR